MAPTSLLDDDDPPSPTPSTMDEGKVFAEPNAGFKDLLSRWHKLDSDRALDASTHDEVIRLPGMDTSNHTAKNKKKKSKKKDGKRSSKLKSSTTSAVSTSSATTTSSSASIDLPSGATSSALSIEAPGTTTSALSIDLPNEDEEEEDILPPPPPNPPSRTSSRQDLKEAFEKSHKSHADKKKVMRQPVNVYQAAPKFTKDFKPPKFSKSDEDKDLIKKALKKNFVFSDLTSRELRPLVSAFEPCSFSTDETIIKQGDRGDYFYIIQKGKVIFQVDGVDVGKAGKGSSFGELALLYTCPRAATVVAAKTTKVFRVDQATFQFILQSQTAESAKEKLELLRGVTFLKDLDVHDLKTLTKVMTPKIFSEGDFLVRKGDPGDAFYVIQEGEVVVKDISVGNTKYEDLLLGPGAHFGERALVTSEPRAANVVGKSRGVAFSIDRTTFEKVLGGMEALVIKANDTRILSGIKMFSDANLPDGVLAELAELITDTCYMEKQYIMQKGKKIAAALQIVREGEVLLKYEDGTTKKVAAGEFFGQETLLAGAENGKPRVPAPFSVSATTNCTVGALTLADCRYIFDTDLLSGKKKAPSFTLSREELKNSLPKEPAVNIKFDSLEKITILGAGSFGQVWLVKGKDEDTGQVKPYALKIQSKHDLFAEGQVTAVIREKQLMTEIQHPNVVNLVTTFQDPTFVYFLTEFVQGGELFSVIHKEEGSGMKESEAKFYAYGIAAAIGHLHSLKIVYRDMKPENVLIDATGYPKLIDFGFAKYCPDKTFTFCGTPGYVPPEIITKRGHDCSADNWSFGVLMYEMISGENPFYFEGMDQITLFRSIVEDDFLPLNDVTREAQNMVRELLLKDPSMRLGASKKRGFVLEHAWFADIDREAMENMEVTPPWKPHPADPYDANQFDDWGALVDKSTESFPELPEDEERRFQEEF